ncbi:hypothetical protein [Fulvimonas soli]|jgi:hypothetical protein|uniref:DUF883 domain-containing protein n=1 Tax=Fulvimonas soli TaxID=155197 RepID=A0A316IGF3_9GAMM|nr:hypothetical protein [Fulvimonas soli]PWK92582.1 hypothetical protein C7456_102317 [Fulvimonas soli]TNY27788.1 hypothetical protein BV497_01870 [Fulvimonas soli]
MNIFRQHARVRAARAQLTAARHALQEPAAALLARGHAHPLGTLGIAAGAGFVLGRLDVHPLRVPGVGPLLGSGAAGLLAQGARLFADLLGGDGDTA